MKQEVQKFSKEEMSSTMLGRRVERQFVLMTYLWRHGDVLEIKRILRNGEGVYWNQKPLKIFNSCFPLASLVFY